MRKSLLLPAFVFVLALTPVPVEATEKASERVSSFAGSFSQVLPIEVPAFRGLEPKLALSYSSEARNGFVGVGWSLAGVSVIERLSPTRGTPLFTWEDKWYLNGQKMFWCGAGITAASCAAGGTASGGSCGGGNEEASLGGVNPPGSDGVAVLITTQFCLPFGWSVSSVDPLGPSQR